MLALIYLGMAIALGDLLCRRFYRFVSVFHRWAAAILVGIFLSTWFTYLAGLACYRTAEPLLWADLLFFLIAAVQKGSRGGDDCAACTGIVKVGLDHAGRTVCCDVCSADRNALCQ